jgi:hypothetical protein
VVNVSHARLFKDEAALAVYPLCEGQEVFAGMKLRLIVDADRAGHAERKRRFRYEGRWGGRRAWPRRPRP